MKLTREEILRKVLHLFFGVIIPAGILYIPLMPLVVSHSGKMIRPWMYPTMILAGFTLILFVVELARFRLGWVQKIFSALFGTVLRREESVKMTGATYIAFSSLICSVIFMYRPDISSMVISTFLWGDGAAALVGISIGKIRVGKKTIEGSAACFILCMIMFFGLFPYVPLLYDRWGGALPLMIGLVASFCIMALELFPLRLSRFTVNDNLYVPALTGMVILLMEKTI